MRGVKSLPRWIFNMGYITDKITSALGLSNDDPQWQWSDHIRPASYRGVPFAVVEGDGEFGRRVAIHEYPFKDTVYVEDLGRSTRKFTLRGFLIQGSLLYSAPDVFSQRESLIAAVEQNGAATLVHPTLGELTVFVPEGGLKITESAESERIFEFTLTCIEGGELEFSIIEGETLGAKDHWLKVLTTASAKYIGLMKKEVRSLTRFIEVAAGVLDNFGIQVESAIGTVTNLVHVLDSVFGNTRYSRYNNGSVGGSVSGITGKKNSSDTDDERGLIDQSIAESANDRENTLDAVEDMSDIGSIEDVPDRVIDVIENMVDSTGSTKEKITSFETLSKNRNPSGQSVADATHAMLVYMSASSMAYMALQYAPNNLDEANDILNRVCEALENALLLCGDNREDELYLALLNQKIDFIRTYTSRFTNLSAMMNIQLTSVQPALTLANRLYQDAGRGEELIQAAKPIHPAFMPIEFRALNK